MTRMKPLQRAAFTCALLALLCLMAPQAKAQITGLNYGWANTITSNTSATVGKILTTATGDFVVCGSFRDSVDLDPGAGTAIEVSTNGSTDMFVAKYNSQGEYLWHVTGKGTGSVTAHHIALDENDDVYVVGYYYDASVQLDPTGTADALAWAGNIEPGFAPSSNRDAFFAKYDDEGNYEWAYALQSGSIEHTPQVTTDLDGHVYVSVGFYRTITMNAASNSQSHASSGSADIILARYDLDGNLDWTQQFRGTYSDSPSALEYSNGRVFLAGSFSSRNLDLDGGSGRATAQYFGYFDTFLASYDTTGAYQWHVSFGGSSSDGIRTIMPDGKGSIYAGGDYQSSSIRFVSGGTLYSRSGGNDAFLLKYDTAGTHQWTAEFGGDGTESVAAIMLDDQDSLWIAGYYTSSSLQLDPSGDAPALSNQGSTDSYIAKFSTSGTFSSSTSLGGSGYDRILDIAQGARGQLQIAGYYNATDLDADLGAGTALLPSIAVAHGFVIDYGGPFKDITRFHVKADATGNNSGDGWANAMTSLQLALDSVQAGDTIVVAAGTYTPSAEGDSLASFNLPDSVLILGGWAGDESTFDSAAQAARDFSANPSILSGDLNGDDTGSSPADFANRADNSGHVVYAGQGVSPAAVLDGFTISGGNATAVTRGGGIYLVGGAPTLNNLLIEGNQSANLGGGISMSPNSVLHLSNSIIRNNGAPNGAGLYAYRASGSLTGVLFEGNQATSGGAVFHDKANLAHTNVSMVKNNASYGGAVYNKFSSPTFINVLVWANTSTVKGGAVYQVGANNPQISYSLVEGSGGSSAWSSYQGTDGGNNYDADPYFVSLANGDYRFFSGSPALNGNTTYGNNIGWYQGPPVVTNTGIALGTSSLAFGSLIKTTDSTLSYTLTGQELTADVAISAPADFMVSLSPTGPFSSSLTLSPAADSSLTDTVYVQFAPQITGPFSGTISHSTDAAPPQSLTVSGTGTVSAVYYVDVDATGTGTGLNWANALTSLPAAIAATEGNPATLYVASGNYTVAPAAEWTQASTLSLHSGLEIYEPYRQRNRHRPGHPGCPRLQHLPHQHRGRFISRRQRLEQQPQ